MVKDAKRYYFDFKENQRGRYLRITQTTMGGRKQIALPHDGISALHDAVQELVRKHASNIGKLWFSSFPWFSISCFFRKYFDPTGVWPWCLSYCVFWYPPF